MWDDHGVHRFSSIPTWIKVSALAVLTIVTVAAWAFLFDAHRTPPPTTYTSVPRVSEEPTAVEEEEEAEEEEATQTPVEPPIVAFLGDGYSTGSTLEDESGRWTTLLSSELGWEEENFALDGSGYISAIVQNGNYAGQVESVVAAEPDLVIISGGRNDLVQSTAAVTEAATSLFQQLREQLPESLIIVVNPWWDSSPQPGEFAILTESISQAASEAGVIYIDSGAPLNDPSLFSGGTINPNSDGHVALAAAVREAITEQLSDDDQDSE